MPWGVQGRKQGWPRKQLAHVHGVEAVHVLFRGDIVKHFFSIYVPGQGGLHQYAVHLRVVVEVVDGLYDPGLGRIGRQAHGHLTHADFLGTLLLGPDIRY